MYLRTLAAEVSKAKSDFYISEGDKIKFGTRYVTAISTPGHTSGCLSFVLDDSSAVFTGDALLIRGCGRTDFQQGNAALLYDSIHTKLFSSLPPSCLVYPGHDYKGNLSSSIGEESAFNPRLTKTKEEFIVLMDKLGLPAPKQIERAVPANMAGGDVPDAHSLVL